MNHLQSTYSGKSGMTLVEVMISMGVVTLVCAGLYTAGLMALRLSQTNRIMTEAHAFAKEGIEELIATGYDSFRGGVIPTVTNFYDSSTHNVEIVRTTETVWHDTDRSVVTNALGAANGYAEVYVKTSFRVPGSSRIASTTLSTVLIDNPITP